MTEREQKLKADTEGIVFSRLTLMGYVEGKDTAGQTSYAPDIVDVVDGLLDEVRFAILNYCNIEEVPYQLKYVWANMTVDYYRWSQAVTSAPQKDAGAGQAFNASGPVSSIQEGDTTVSFSSGLASAGVSTADSTVAHSMSAVLDEVVMNYTNHLNRFRRIVW